MSFDRNDALRHAEKLLRQGKLDQAIAEYGRVIDEQPRDWNTANILGDLYVRAGQPDKAIEQFTRVADGVAADGFLPKAGALYKKILKIRSDDEHALLQTAEIAAMQGLLADARRTLHAIADRRRGRNDLAGAARMAIRIGALDPKDYDARSAAARARASLGEVTAAVSDWRALATDLVENERSADAVAALQEALALAPDDAELRAQLARVCLSAGDLATAARYVTTETAANDPRLLLSLADARFREGQLEEGFALADRAVEQDAFCLPDVALLAAAIGEAASETGFRILAHVVEGPVARAEWMDAVAALEAFLGRLPQHVPALQRLVEVCVDGDLDAKLSEAQARLAEAYLETGVPAGARVIAEDLMGRDPENPAHLRLLRRALSVGGVANVEQEVEEILRRQSESQGALADEVLSLASQEPPHHTPDVAHGPPAPAQAPPPPMPAAAPTRAPAESMEVDLSGVLDEIRKPPVAAPASPDLDEVFAQMRDDVSRRAADVAEQALARGMALSAVGQVDEAITLIEGASQAPRLRFRAAAALGRIFRDQGQLLRAMEWFERAAEAPAPSVEEGHALMYDLADALESAGEVAPALAVFLELQADTGVFRDLAHRIERLARQAGG